MEAALLVPEAIRREGLTLQLQTNALELITTSGHCIEQRLKVNKYWN